MRRLAADRRKHEIGLVVARVPAVLVGAVVRRRARDRAERVRHLVRVTAAVETPTQAR